MTVLLLGGAVLKKPLLKKSLSLAAVLCKADKVVVLPPTENKEAQTPLSWIAKVTMQAVVVVIHASSSSAP